MIPLTMHPVKDMIRVCYLAHRKCLQMRVWMQTSRSPPAVVYLCDLFFLFIFFNCSRSSAITFTALLASDNLPFCPAETLSDTHTALFAYGFHLEIVVLAIRQTGRKRNYGAGLRSMTARRCERAHVRHVCMR